MTDKKSDKKSELCVWCGSYRVKSDTMPVVGHPSGPYDVTIFTCMDCNSHWGKGKKLYE